MSVVRGASSRKRTCWMCSSSGQRAITRAMVDAEGPLRLRIDLAVDCTAGISAALSSDEIYSFQVYESRRSVRANRQIQAVFVLTLKLLYL